MRPEIELRRPEFTEGVKVTLGDGQEWTFPRPLLRIAPVRNAAGGFDLKRTPPFGAAFQAEFEAYLDAAAERGPADEDDDGSDILASLAARASLAAQLLLRNYDLSDDDIAELLYLDMDSGGGGTVAMWGAIDGVLVGEAPKPSAVG